LEELLTSQNFFDITDPATATTVFTNGLEASNEQFFRRTNPSCRASHKGPARPWWDEECKTAVKEARRAFREWRDSPISTTKREEWRKAEARKRRTIITSKKNAWSTFIANLGPNDQPKMWAFVRNMVGNGSDVSATGQALKSGGHTFQTPQEKAALFLDRFSSVHPRNIANNRHFEAEISNKIRSRTTDPLNDAFTPEELDKAMPKSKSNATGLDLIHNKMIRNLSIPNKTSLLHLFNTLLTYTYVPAQWKNAVVIPLLKKGKPADDPNSYRPVSLTSNLGKTFERLANRLHWFLEAKGIINTAQAGFRRGCSTTDQIAQLDADIKHSFNQKRSTVATFLDINKAYDTVWIQGLLFKMAKKGIAGSFLGWIKEFLTRRSMSVRIGSVTSIPTQVTKIFFYADDVLLYSMVKHPADAEVTLQPALDKVRRWGRKWKFRFAPDKNAMVVFTRAQNLGTILFSTWMAIESPPNPPLNSWDFGSTQSCCGNPTSIT
jgi:hypothetical protein